MKSFCKPVVNSVNENFVHPLGDTRPYADVLINAQPIKAMIDSGANRSILGANGIHLINRLDLSFRPYKNIDLTTASGDKLHVIGYVDLPITVSGTTKILEALVCQDVPKCIILGVDFCKLFKVSVDFEQDKFSIGSMDSLTMRCSDDLSVNQQVQLASVVDSFKSLAHDNLTRTTLVYHKIDTGDHPPIKQRYYPLSPAMQKFVNIEIDRMLELGVIRESSSPWSSPMLLVKKSDDSYRLCFDGRKLNSITKKDSYPIPYLSSILDRLNDCRYLSTIDLKKAFWQIPLTPDSCEKTAFTVPQRGLFEYVVVPFGISNAPASQQRFMEKIFGSLLGEKLFVYLDDIVLISSTFAEHMELLKEVRRRLFEANLTINFDKCKFCRSSLAYLGFIVDKSGLHTDPAKIDAIVNYPKPTTATGVKRFLGMCSWYRRFVPDFASISAPITELIKGRVKKQTITWNANADECFETLKSLLVRSPILGSPDFDKPFNIQCDASNLGLGSVLTQGDGENEKVIAYASRTLNKAERNYTVTERECLAVIFGITKFRPYVEGTHFTVYTDHYSLLWLTNMKEPTGRLCRWSVKLSQFDFSIKHRKGKHNVVPDALSRSPLETCFIQLEPEDHDLWYKKMLNSVETKPESFPDWRIENSQLFKLIPNRHDIRSNLIEWKQVIPKSRRNEILKLCHDEPTSAHFGIFKTYQRILENYYWPKLRYDVSRFVKRCQICLGSKASQGGRYGLMGSEKKVRFPFQCLSLDLMGPFPRSKAGNTMLIVVCDWLTKFVLVKAVHRATTKNIIKFVENEIFLIFGVPQILMVDNGPQFISSEFRKFTANYSVQKVWYNAVYHPQINYVERTNRVLGSAMRSFITNDHRNWDSQIYKIAHAIRTSVHEVTGYTPSFLNLGRTVPSKGDYYGRLTEFDEEELSLDSRELIATEMNDMSDLHLEVKRRLKVAYDKYANYYNLRKRSIHFKKGDIVWRRNYVLSDAGKHFSSKLAPKYVRCTVKEVTGRLTYRLTDHTGKDCGVWHVKDLKPNPIVEDELPDP